MILVKKNLDNEYADRWLRSADSIYASNSCADKYNTVYYKYYGYICGIAPCFII